MKSQFWDTLPWCVKIFIVGLLIIIPSLCQAQKIPQYSQYMLNNFLINPAITGIENYMDARVGYRNQWTGLEGAPRTFYFTMHSDFGFKNMMNRTRRGISGNRTNHHHGVGLNILSDQIGAFERSQFHITYAYHVPITDKIKFSAGMAAGIHQISINPDKIDGADLSDFAISSETLNNLRPNISLGLWLYSDQFYLGASMLEVLRNDYQFGDYQSNPFDHQRHLLITGAFKLKINDIFALTPSILLKNLQPSQPALDFNLLATFYDRFSAGLSYRNTEDIILLTRFIVNSSMEVGYSYDYGYSALSQYSGGSHEIMIGVRFNNREKILCPSNLW